MEIISLIFSFAPIETMTKGRAYVTIDTEDRPKYITYFDSQNKRAKQIDLDYPHKGLSPHVHHGYYHNENDSLKGASKLTTEERKMVERVIDIWYNKCNKQ